MKKLVLAVSIFIAYQLQAQVKLDKGIMMEKKNAFYDSIIRMNDAYSEPKSTSKKMELKMDFSGVDFPKSLNEFKTIKAINPVSQGNTGTCWSFSSISFYEAEIARLTGSVIDLSEMYNVYWQYVEKAKEFVRTRGNSVFDEGSESNATQLMMKKYGTVPAYAFTGMKDGQPFQDHSKMADEMKAYLQSVKTNNAWNTDEVIATIKSIMNFYMGTPPTSVEWKGVNMSPLDFMKNICKLNPDDYVELMSFANMPYWTRQEYAVPDNWWHSKDYVNVPLDVYMSTLKKAAANGISAVIGGDVSNEPGMYNKYGVAMVPSFDIPSAYIDENARLFRFLNGTTTDDHGMHMVGYCEKPNGTWYLIKDSGSNGHNNMYADGYWFMHEDYVKLKMTTYTVPKSLVKDILDKVK